MTFAPSNSATSCGCNGPTVITNWYDLFDTQPKNPLDLIAYAKLGSSIGVFTNSSTYLNSSTWYPNVLAIASAPTCAALGTDNLQMVADADQWNMQHLTADLAATLSPPLQKLIFLRGGTQWQMNIPLNFGAGTYPDVQISFRDNGATRGDYAGQIPVISFTSAGFTGAVSLQLTLKQLGHVVMGIRQIDNTAKYYMCESEWAIVP